MRKEYAQKMEYLATVYDGRTGQTHAGYSLCDSGDRRKSLGATAGAAIALHDPFDGERHRGRPAASD